MVRSRHIPAVILVVAAVTAGAAACGGSSSGSPPSSPAHTVTVTANPSPSGTTAPSPGAPGTPTHTAAPSPSGTVQQSAAMIVSAYFSAIDAHDYRTAWNLGGKHLSSSYAAFVAGFATTAGDSVTFTHTTGSTVTLTLDALQTDGTVKHFAGTYTVRDGEIVGASVHEVGQSASPSATPFANCAEAHRAGRFDIPRGDPAYAPHLDRDHDGVACEPDE